MAKASLAANWDVGGPSVLAWERKLARWCERVSLKSLDGERAAEEWTEEWTDWSHHHSQQGGESELESTLSDLGRAEEEGWRVVFVCCFHIEIPTECST